MWAHVITGIYQELQREQSSPSHETFVYSKKEGWEDYSSFTIFAEWVLANIFTTRCRSLMGVSPLVIGSKL